MDIYLKPTCENAPVFNTETITKQTNVDKAKSQARQQDRHIPKLYCLKQTFWIIIIFTGAQQFLLFLLFFGVANLPKTKKKKKRKRHEIK